LKVDLLYLSHNRRAFTELTFELLIQNTNWSLVDRLVVYDDRSIDGARAEIASRIDRVPVPAEIRDHEFGSPVAVMNHYTKSADSEFFVKIDNDLALPPGWLEVFLQVHERHPSATLIGSESPFMGPPPADFDGVYDLTHWRHIGGNGLMRTSFFKSTGPMGVDGYHGFTGHQWNWNPERGWVTPDILLCLLDRCPAEPWVSLSAEYVKQGWQRRWGKIDPGYSMYWDWFTDQEEAAA
jgi:glycosyltransferase involved in cell wall biosynthesis